MKELEDLLGCIDDEQTVDNFTKFEIFTSNTVTKIALALDVVDKEDVDIEAFGFDFGHNAIKVVSLLKDFETYEEIQQRFIFFMKELQDEEFLFDSFIRSYEDAKLFKIDFSSFMLAYAIVEDHMESEFINAFTNYKF